jgi:hypothetical protein
MTDKERSNDNNNNNNCEIDFSWVVIKKILTANLSQMKHSSRVLKDYDKSHHRIT